MDKMIITDADLRSYTHNIIRQIATSQARFSGIIGVARGGLVVANMLSQYYDVPMHTVTWNLRDHARRDRHGLTHVASRLSNSENMLLVDDICDGGHTFFELKNALAELSVNHAVTLRSAALVHNEGCKLFTPDYSGVTINKNKHDVWVEFPWETWWQG